MSTRSKVVVEILAMPLDKTGERYEKYRTFLGIMWGVTIGNLLASWLNISLPDWIRAILSYGSIAAFWIAWVRHVFQKKSATILAPEPPECIALGIEPSCNMLALGAKDEEGNITNLPLYRKFRCQKREENGQTVYTFVGKPSKPFREVAKLSITADPKDRCVCHKVCNVIVEYVAPEDVRPDWLAKLDSIAEEASSGFVKVPQKAIDAVMRQNEEKEE